MAETVKRGLRYYLNFPDPETGTRLWLFLLGGVGRLLFAAFVAYCAVGVDSMGLFFATFIAFRYVQNIAFDVGHVRSQIEKHLAATRAVATAKLSV